MSDSCRESFQQTLFENHFHAFNLCRQVLYPKQDHGGSQSTECGKRLVIVKLAAGTQANLIYQANLVKYSPLMLISKLSKSAFI